MKQVNKYNLLEMMTILAILATLGSILLTSIHNSKDLNNKVTCLSNLKQIRTIAELHRTDNGELPYSEIWLTDFSFAREYLGEDISLSIFNCPGDEDAAVSSYSDLMYNTSYYYIPTIKQLEQNIEDGLDFGVHGGNLDLLKLLRGGVIYDKSESHHNGAINIVYLFDQGDPDAEEIVSVVETINVVEDPVELPLEVEVIEFEIETIKLVGDNLNFVLSDGNDQVQVSEDGSKWKVKAVYDDGRWEEELWFDMSDVGEIVLFGLGGDDQIQMSSTSVPVFMDGGEGDDQLEGGSGDDTLIGGPGNEQIQGGDGDDTLSGGDGNDYVEGGEGNDTVDGGSGNNDVKD